jgi:hypothetical protein
VTNLHNGTGFDALPTRPVVATTNAGRVLIGYSCPRSSTVAGSFRLIDVTRSARPRARRSTGSGLSTGLSSIDLPESTPAGQILR